jgi:hypothetical protein
MIAGRLMRVGETGTGEFENWVGALESCAAKLGTDGELPETPCPIGDWGLIDGVSVSTATEGFAGKWAEPEWLGKRSGAKTAADRMAGTMLAAEITGDIVCALDSTGEGETGAFEICSGARETSVAMRGNTADGGSGVVVVLAKVATGSAWRGSEAGTAEA